MQDVGEQHNSCSALDRRLRRERVDRLCELNVIEQAANVCQTTIVQDAWGRGQALAIHGWIYGLAGRAASATWAYPRATIDGIDATYHTALASLGPGSGEPVTCGAARRRPGLSL